MKTLKNLSLLAFASVLIWSCGSDPENLMVSSITATGTSFEDGSALTSDLNGSASAEDVALDAVITVTFDKEVDATTVNTSNVKIADADGNDVALTATGSGSSITIDPTEDFARGTNYTLTVNNVLAADEGPLTSLSRTFKTEGRAPVVPPHVDDQVLYIPFNGSTEDVTGNYSIANEIAFSLTDDRFGQGASAGLFDGDETIVEIADAMSLTATDDFTISFWINSDGSDVNADGATRGQFVMGLAGWHGFQFEIFGDYGGAKLASTYSLADGTTASQDLWWSTQGNLGWMGWTFDQDISAAGGLRALIEGQWTHFVVSYDAATKIGAIYVNGELRKSQDFNLYGDTHPLYNATGMGYAGNDAPGDRLALGFIQGSENAVIADDWANPIGFPDNNHFKGGMDDVRFFKASFTADDVAELYNAEK